MVDEAKNFEPLDPGRVELMDPIEVRYWCKHFGCTEQQLRDAVAEVGAHVAAVRQRLTRSATD